MPTSRRKATKSAAPAQKPAKKPAAPFLAKGKAKPVRPAKSPVAPKKPSKVPALARKAAPAKPVPAPKAPPVPVRPLMKLGREDLAAFRWAGRRRGVPVERPPAPATGLDAATAFAQVAVRDGHASPLAPLRPDGKVATGLRGTIDPAAVFAPSAGRPCAACLTKPCVCADTRPGVHKDSPYGEESKVDNRVTSWRRWP